MHDDARPRSGGIFVRFVLPVLAGALIAGVSASIMWLIDKTVR
jgi:hypothetical protein